MRKTDKNKYIKLAAQSEEKQVPNGWVYVGFGKIGGLEFGGSLDVKFSSESWRNEDGNWGTNPLWEYACPVKIWEEKTGLLFESHDKKESSEKGKTSKEWLETLPSPYKELAVYNCLTIGHPTGIAMNLRGAISGGFDWNKSAQGATFWNIIKNGCKNSNFVWPEIPDETKEKVLKGLCDYDIVLDKKKNQVRVGCQTISRENALKIAAEFQNFFAASEQ